MTPDTHSCLHVEARYSMEHFTAQYHGSSHSPRFQQQLQICQHNDTYLRPLKANASINLTLHVTIWSTKKLFMWTHLNAQMHEWISWFIARVTPTDDNGELWRLKDGLQRRGEAEMHCSVLTSIWYEEFSHCEAIRRNFSVPDVENRGTY